MTLNGLTPGTIILSDDDPFKEYLIYAGCQPEFPISSANVDWRRRDGEDRFFQLGLVLVEETKTGRLGWNNINAGWNPRVVKEAPPPFFCIECSTLLGRIDYLCNACRG